jgi:hypothetical protein
MAQMRPVSLTKVAPFFYPKKANYAKDTNPAQSDAGNCQTLS